MKSLTGPIVALVAVALLVGGFLAFTGGSSAEEKREQRRTAEQAGPAGRCAPVSLDRAQTATRTFLDRYFSADGGSAVDGAGPVQVGGGWQLQVNVDPAARLDRQPDCFEGVPVVYLRRGGVPENPR